jgi:hypothetical protein
MPEDLRFPAPRPSEVKDGYWNCCDAKRQVALPFGDNDKVTEWHWACRSCSNSSPAHRGQWAGYAREELKGWDLVMDNGFGSTIVVDPGPHGMLLVSVMTVKVLDADIEDRDLAFAQDFR